MQLSLLRVSGQLLRQRARPDCTRLFSSTSTVFARRKKIEFDPVTSEEAEDILDDDYDNDDTTSGGHMQLRDQRQQLYYMRVIEHEMPKLVALRRPFIPPPPSHALIARSIDYGGEEHPVVNKRVITVSVDHLPLRDKAAVHKIKILAGPRWSQKPPADSGVSGIADWGNGYIKISCEDFPNPAMNLKWASDTLDKLVAAANDLKADRMRNIPIDTRHIIAKARKGKKGDHLRGRLGDRASIYDFPREWLPPDSQKPKTFSGAS